MVVKRVLAWISGLNRWAKLGLVIGGYVASAAVAALAVAIYDRRFTDQDNQTMGGMIAGGEMIYFCGVYTLLSIVPTGFSLWFLRQNRRAWSLFSGGCLAFAVVGLVVVLAMLPWHGFPQRWLLAELFGLAQELGSPVWFAGFVLFAFLAPWRDLRRRLVIAAACEVVIGVCALVHFLPAFFN